MNLTKEQITEINNKADGFLLDQGIFTEPWGIDVKEKRPVIYQRVETSGSNGGSYCSKARPYTRDYSDDLQNWTTLDEVLNILAPNITYLQYRRIMSTLVKSNEDTQYNYYGNYDNYIIRWIPLEELITFLEQNNIK